MPTIQVSQQTIDREREAFLADFKSLQTESTDKGALGLPGIEIILKYIAEKVVLAMFVGFVNRVLYEKVTKKQTAAELAEAHSGIITLGLNAKPVVDPKTLRQDLTAMVTSEGIQQAQAEVLVDKMLERSKSTLHLEP
jgi:hypothetical protein